MITSSTSARSAIAVVLCVALILIISWRFLEIAPHWAGGLPPAYPGQYQTRLLGVAVGVSLCGAVFVSQMFGRTRRGTQVAYWGLLAVAAAALVGQLIMNR